LSYSGEASRCSWICRGGWQWVSQPVPFWPIRVYLEERDLRRQLGESIILPIFKKDTHNEFSSHGVNLTPVTTKPLGSIVFRVTAERESLTYFGCAPASEQQQLQPNTDSFIKPEPSDSASETEMSNPSEHPLVVQQQRTRPLRWLGHILCMPEDRLRRRADLPSPVLNRSDRELSPSVRNYPISEQTEHAIAYNAWLYAPHSRFPMMETAAAGTNVPMFLNIPVTIQREALEVMKNFTYLDSCTSFEGSASDEASARISKARIKLPKLCHLWHQKRTSLDPRTAGWKLMNRQKGVKENTKSLGAFGTCAPEAEDDIRVTHKCSVLSPTYRSEPYLRELSQRQTLFHLSGCIENTSTEHRPKWKSLNTYRPPACPMDINSGNGVGTEPSRNPASDWTEIIIEIPNKILYSHSSLLHCFNQPWNQNIFGGKDTCLNPWDVNHLDRISRAT
ncbi:hypothetical protein CLF_101410, partial [Clonorchis sinensis]